MMEKIIKEIKNLKSGSYGKDFLLTWEKSREELEQVLLIADTLKALRDKNISTRCFDSGIAVSLFRDNSTRTRFSFASAANLLGLEIQDLDEKKSQIAHGETVRETANMISFLTEVIGIRDDIFLGEGNKVKVTIMYRGREMDHIELGRKILDKLVNELLDKVVVESMPRVEGRNMVMMIAPKKDERPAKSANQSN